MAVDRKQITERLSRFYDFNSKIVLYVGAGGQQLLDPSVKVKQLIAIDQDPNSLQELQVKVTAEGRSDSVSVVAADFAEIDLRGDVVYFEFCLHEINDPARALRHARTLAPDTVVIDHLPHSAWSFYAAEENDVDRGAQALDGFGVRRRQLFRTEQRFADYEELVTKLKYQGALSLSRIQQYSGSTNIVIPMEYQLALL